MKHLASKHKTFVLHLYNVGPTSKTLGRRCINVIVQKNNVKRSTSMMGGYVHAGINVFQISEKMFSADVRTNIFTNE